PLRDVPLHRSSLYASRPVLRARRAPRRPRVARRPRRRSPRPRAERHARPARPRHRHRGLPAGARPRPPLLRPPLRPHPRRRLPRRPGPPPAGLRGRDDLRRRGHARRDARRARPPRAGGAPGGGYHGERPVTDDELGAVVAGLRRRVCPGGEVVVSFDACHSGSATRGEMPTRTGGPPIGPPGPGAAGTRGGAEAGVAALDAPAAGTRGDGDEALAPYIFFAAAAHDELDHEMYQPNRQPRMAVGPLSYALSVTLSQLGEGETYRRLFERMAAEFTAAGLNQQTPQAEGDLDTEVFSGRAVVQQPYVTVTGYDPATREVYVGSGLLQGLTEGSRVAFFPAGTDRPEGAP